MDSNNIPIFLGDDIFTLKELGDIADMDLTDGLQALCDRGFCGDENKGKRWYEVIKPGGFGLISVPTEEDVLEKAIYDQYEEVQTEYNEALDKGLDITEIKARLLKKRKAWKAVKKLTTPPKDC